MTDTPSEEKPESLDSAQPPKKRVTRKSTTRSSAVATSEVKPATRRRSAKATTDATPSVEVAPVVSSQSTEAPAKPTTRRRSSTKKVAAEQDSSPIAQQEENSAISEQGESKPTKRTTTRRKKETASETPTSSLEVTSDASIADPQAQKPRIRRSRKTVENVDTDIPEVGSMEQESKPVRRQTRRLQPTTPEEVATESATPSLFEPKEVEEASRQVNQTETPQLTVIHETDRNNNQQRDRQGSYDNWNNRRNNNRRFRDNDRRNNQFRNNNRRDNRNFRDSGNNGSSNQPTSRVRDTRMRQQGRNNEFENQPKQQVELGPPQEVDGLLEITAKGFGFLRTAETSFEQTSNAVYVSSGVIRNHGLRHAQWIHGIARSSVNGLQLTEVTSVNGMTWEKARLLPHFDELKAINPNKRISFETTSNRYTTRVLDLMAPVGRGQRGLIVAPPRTGKTTFLQHMAEAVTENYQDSLHLMILLIDERPEEVTEFKRNIKGAEIYASSNDSKARNHCRMAELCIERAKRLVEAGQHVFLLMDSITRLARAYNNAEVGSGRTMSGGIDARALEMPRRLFAAARNTRQAGSLTIIATALIETNSRMDDLIFQEFKGTGNMELVLNRRIAEQYIYPAVDILKSGTRREELILPEIWIDKVHLIRRALAGHKPVEAIERLLFFLQKYPKNSQMLLDLKQRA